MTHPGGGHHSDVRPRCIFRYQAERKERYSNARKIINIFGFLLTSSYLCIIKQITDKIWDFTDYFLLS